MSETIKPDAAGDVEKFMQLLVEVASALNKVGARMALDLTMVQVQQIAALRAKNWRTGSDVTIDAYGEAKVCLICVSHDGRKRVEILHITVTPPKCGTIAS